MRDYPNADERRVVTMLCAMESWVAGLLESAPKCVDKPRLKQRLRHVLGHLEKLNVGAVEDLSLEAVDSLSRYINGQDIQIVPKDKVKKEGTHVVVELDDFKLLTSRIDDCYTCVKSPAEVKACKIRKAMTRCGAIPTGDRAECPFMP